MTFFIWTTLSFAVPATGLTSSMAIPANDIISQSIISDQLANGIMTNLGILLPTEGADFAYLYTGSVGQAPQIGTDLGPTGQNGDRVTLNVELQAPSTANSARFDFYFLSAEYPEFVNTSYNDKFEVNINGTAFSGNAAIDSQGNLVTVNSAYFTITNSADLQGTGFDGGIGGGTDWLTIVVPIDPNDTVSFEFTVYDVYDGIYDSAVLLDNFAWSTSDVDTPVIVTPIRVDYLSPKRGPIEGGVQTEVYGIDFNSTCVAYFDGIEANTSFVNSNRLVAEVPPHAVGLVDVTVGCVAVEDVLVGAFTYFDGEEGEHPPELQTATPYQVSTQGGENVDLLGSYFDAATVVTVDGEIVDSQFTDSTRIQISTLAHEEGFATVRVENPNGLSDERSGLLYFYLPSVNEEPTDTGSVEDSFDTADEDSEDGTALPKNDVGCSSVPRPIGFTLIPLLGFVIFNRRNKESIK